VLGAHRAGFFPTQREATRLELALRYGPGVGAFPDWWDAAQAAGRLAIAEWEWSGEPRPCRYWWYVRRDVAAWAEAKARRPLGAAEKDS